MKKFFSKTIIYFFGDKKRAVIFLIIFLTLLFSRFYLLEARLHFNWDQVDNAWAAKRILIDHNFPLVGMVAKTDSGFNIGPLYYYLVAIFYWIFNMNPIASGVLASLTSVFTFFVLFYVVKKLFSSNVAIIASFIYTVSNFIIITDRSQWPVNFIPAVSIIIFYSLYQVVLGQVKYLILLAFALGISFQIHFTSVFYPLIIFLTLPFFPRKRKTISYIFFSVIIFLIFISPLIVHELQTKSSGFTSLVNYLHTYYHGFHLVRVLQITHDAFIEFNLILQTPFADLLSRFFLPLFVVLYYFQERSKKRLLFCYLTILWFIIPWFVFSTYSGEITNYYFFLTRPLVIIIFSYLSYFVYQQKNIFCKFLIILFWVYYAFINIKNFYLGENSDYKNNIDKTLQIIQEGRKQLPYENIPESYLYYYYTNYKK